MKKKGRDPFTIRDGANYIITTNNDWFINPSKGARRFVALQMSDKYAGIADEEKEAYFDRIHQADARALAKVLYTRDLQDFNPRKFAKTELLQDQIEKGWDSVTAWWYQLLRDGIYYHREGTSHEFNTHICELATKKDTTDDTKIRYVKTFLYENYTQTNSGYDKKLVNTEFFKKLRTLINFAEIRAQVYKSRIAVIVFPDLPDCRAAFDKIQNYKYNWGEV